MRLRWTVVVRGVPPAEIRHGGVLEQAAAGPVPVRVDCPAGTHLGDLPGLAAVLDVSSPAAPVASVDGLQVDPCHVVGTHPLLDGAVLTLTWATGPGRRRVRTGEVGAEDPRRMSGRPHLLELVVLAGPDAGVVRPLDGQQLRCGRSATADVRVDDPRLSRSHCDLVIDADGVLVRDLGSTNGTESGAPPTGTGRGTIPVHRGERLLLDQRCRIGASVVAVRPSQPARVDHEEPVARGPAPEAGRTTDGTVPVRRAPRARVPEHVPELSLPPPPRPPRAVGFPLLAVLLPGLAAAVLVMWTGSTVYLLLAGLGPLLVAGSWFTTRRDARREGRLGRHEHARRCAELRADATAAASRLAEARLAAMPDADTLLGGCTTPGSRVWERDLQDDDALRLRLGLAARQVAPIGTSTRASTGAAAPDALLPRVRLRYADGRTEHVASPWDLVSVDLADGAVGVVEPGDASSARFLIGQLAALLPPGRLCVHPVIGPGSRERWRWLRLLPHVLSQPPDGVAPPTGSRVRDAARWVGDLVTARVAAVQGPERSREHVAVLVVLDDPGGELSSEDLAWLPDAHRVGVHVLAVALGAGGLPRGCRTVVQPCSPDAVELRVTRVSDGSSAVVVADRVGRWWADRLARRLAPLRLSDDGEATLPDTVALTDLLDLSEDAVDARWQTCGDGLGVPLGAGADGPFVVDLVASGPHALLAGTTGSGKSELLRAWLLAMAASYPPQLLSLLLVDYKGGATFDDLADLPHTVGLLSDLDPAATTRVLHSLRAEVRRREHLLAAAGARDLLELRRRSSPQDRFPRLLVVVDEFRILSEDAPEVLAEFVRLAATGRSLGIHLVLATQRPGGVVSADIRANASLRVALRVQDGAESRDVVDRPDAAALPADRPGRAVVVGVAVDGTIQGAWVGGSDDSPLALEPDQDWSADLSTAPPDGTGPNLRPAPPDAGSAARQLTTRLARLADATGRPAAQSPWLPPLPAGCTDSRGPGGDGSETDDPAALVLGVTDLPWSQSRGELSWSPLSDGPALVLGGGGSGRSSTLSRIAHEASRRGWPVVRLSGDGDDPDHSADTLKSLATALVRDQEQLSPPVPRLVLLVDDADALLDPAGDPTLLDLLSRTMRTGHRAGIAVAVAGGRPTATSRLATMARLRLVHRTTDPVDAVAAGLPVGARPTSDTPGRCLVIGLASRLTGTDDPRAAVEAQVFTPAARDAMPDAVPPDVPRPLPRRLRGPLTPAVTASGRLPVGVVTPRGEMWGLAPRTPLLAVCGPSRSGRTSVLRTLHEHALPAGLHVAWLGHGVLDPPTAPEGARAVDLLLVDDVERLDGRTTHALESWLSGGEGMLAQHLGPRATVVLAGLTDAFADSFHGLPLLVRRHGLGIVLAPGRTDARNVLGCREPAEQRTQLPGRGLLVERGRVRRIQLALPGTPAAPELAAHQDLAQLDARAPTEHYRSFDGQTGDPPHDRPLGAAPARRPRPQPTG